MFYFYWILMMIALISSFAYLSNAYHTKRFALFVSSGVQCVLTLVLVFVDLVSSVHVSTRGFCFLWEQINTGNVVSSLIIFAYLITFTLVIVNGKMIVSDKRENSIVV